MKILITGVAGFIGSHLCESLLKNKEFTVYGIDNFNEFYDPKIKRKNITSLVKSENFTLFEGNILDKVFLEGIFSKTSPECLIHLAAYAGVRPSIQNPELYYTHNITGTLTLLECCKKYNVKRILFSSSSSIYGNNKKSPFSESDFVDNPISPYAVTKKAGELMCFNYHHLYKIEMACLRFFTVYGPRQRPEMAIAKFTKRIDNEQEVSVFNMGKCIRDYTYIDDIVQGIEKILIIPKLTYDIVNLGNSNTISTLELITLIEQELDKKALITLCPSQPGDVEKTYADISHAQKIYGYQPNFPIENGIHEFVRWYKTVKE